MRAGKGSDELTGYDLKGLPQEQDEDDEREQCPFCNRKFAKETLARHRPHCETKMTSKGSMKYGSIKNKNNK